MKRNQFGRGLRLLQKKKKKDHFRESVEIEKNSYKLSPPRLSTPGAQPRVGRDGPWPMAHGKNSPAHPKEFRDGKKSYPTRRGKNFACQFYEPNDEKIFY